MSIPTEANLRRLISENTILKQFAPIVAELSVYYLYKRSKVERNKKTEIICPLIFFKQFVLKGFLLVVFMYFYYEVSIPAL